MMTDAQDWLIEARNVVKGYAFGGGRIEVLKGVDHRFPRGRWTAILGASGSGKTTLLNLLGALERPDGGTLLYNGQDYAELASGRAAARFRAEKIGFVFQSYQLLPEFTILENVMLPGMLAGGSRRQLRARAEELLAWTGLRERLQHRPMELSGGEQQRAAIARALLNDPELLLADEPTGNLDAATGDGIMALLHALPPPAGGPRTVILITHNRALAEATADAVVTLENGVLHPSGPVGI